MTETARLMAFKCPGLTMRLVVLSFIMTLSMLVLSAPAEAACTVPNSITNGQVADATKVMGNFNALKDCVDGTVSPSGTPVAGNLAVFSGSGTVTGGNLSGDCTTAGTLAVTCTKANGTAFGYFATGADAGQLTGTVSVNRFNNGVDANDTHFLRGDGVWAIPAGGGGGGGSAVFTRHRVATTGDAFIDVSLDVDEGFMYEVIVEGAIGASNALVGFRISSDTGTTFYSGSTDYKHAGSGSASYIDLTNGNTVGTGRKFLAKFTLSGMNVVTNDKIALSGTVFTAGTTGGILNGAIGGHNNGLAANNFNAFRIYLSAGTMDGMTVYVRRAF